MSIYTCTICNMLSYLQCSEHECFYICSTTFYIVNGLPLPWLHIIFAHAWVHSVDLSHDAHIVVHICMQCWIKLLSAVIGSMKDACLYMSYQEGMCLKKSLLCTKWYTSGITILNSFLLTQCVIDYFLLGVVISYTPLQ